MVTNSHPAVSAEVVHQINCDGEMESFIEVLIEVDEGDSDFAVLVSSRRAEADYFPAHGVSLPIDITKTVTAAPFQSFESWGRAPLGAIHFVQGIH